MHRWLDHIADEFPEREFIVTDARAYSYREMQRWSCDLAGGWRPGAWARATMSRS